MLPASLRKWVAFGTGVGVEIDGSILHVAVVRVRPAGVETMAAAFFEGFGERPASEWGAEMAEFLTKSGASGKPAILVLPPQDVVSRTLALPGVQKKDLASALAFEMDAIAPYGDQPTATAWAPVSESGVLAGVAKSEIVAKYATLFSEAGVPVASISTPAAVLYAAGHLLETAQREYLAVDARAEETRVYGESAHLPVFWAAIEAQEERAVALAGAQMRLSGADPVAIGPGSLAIAAATAAACPWIATSLNLLPAEQRASRSPWMLAPTMALLAMTLVAGVALAGFRQFEDRRLLKDLNAEISKVEPSARRAAQAERNRAAATARIDQLRSFRERTRKDLDVLKETTRLIAPPAWANQLDIGRNTVSVAGESPSAEGLLKEFDASALFRASEFTSPLSRSATPGMDNFRIRAEREGPVK